MPVRESIPGILQHVQPQVMQTLVLPTYVAMACSHQTMSHSFISCNYPPA
jgi:hypothetical protein